MFGVSGANFVSLTIIIIGRSEEYGKNVRSDHKRLSLHDICGVKKE